MNFAIAIWLEPVLSFKAVIASLIIYPFKIAHVKFRSKGKITNQSRVYYLRVRRMGPEFLRS